MLEVSCPRMNGLPQGAYSSGRTSVICNVDGQKLGISAVNVWRIGMDCGHECCEPGIECECRQRPGKVK